MAWREDVFKICLGFARNYADAEDLSQDVYLKALRKIGTVRTPRAARGWLLRIARNTCLDHRKRARLFQTFRLRENDSETGAAQPDADLGAAPGRLARLKEAVGRLGRRQKEVFVLREYGELSYEEVAAVLGIKVGTVMSRLNRARRSLERSMKEGSRG